MNDNLNMAFSLLRVHRNVKPLVFGFIFLVGVVVVCLEMMGLMSTGTSKCECLLLKKKKVHYPMFLIVFVLVEL